MVATPDIRTLWRIYNQGMALTGQVGERGETLLTLDAVLCLSGEPHLELNYAVVSGGEDAPERLREFASRIRERGDSAYLTASQAVAAQVEPVARELRLESAAPAPLMVRPGRPSEPCSPDRGRSAPATAGALFRVDHVRTERSLRDLVCVTAEAFDVPLDQVERAIGPVTLELPGIDVFVGYDGDEAASCAFTSSVGGYAGLWDMATLPSRQREGAGAAVLGHALAHLSADTTLFYMTASESGRRLYERFGFTVVEMSPTWIVRS